MVTIHGLFQKNQQSTRTWDTLEKAGQSRYRWCAITLASLLAASLATDAFADGLELQFPDGSVTSTNYSTSAPNDPVRLISLAGGTATYSGILSGEGAVRKTGPGTILFNNANTYGGGTFVEGGTLEVGVGGEINHSEATLFLGTADGETGRLVLSGGTINDHFARIGSAENSEGIATVTSGTWDNAQQFHVGSDGKGTLNLSGGTITVGSSSFIGAGATSEGAAFVSGGSWVSAGALFVGYKGSGTLEIAGGTASNSFARIGEHSTGTVTVSGTGSTWTNTGSLYVGNGGSGTLNVLDGGTVTSAGSSRIGDLSGVHGIVTISGAGSTWTNTGELYVGNGGSGTLNVLGSGQLVTQGPVVIGNFSGGSGMATVSGAGSKWTISDVLEVAGWSGNGSLEIKAGGFVSSAGTRLATGPQTNGVIQLSGDESARGVLSTGYIRRTHPTFAGSGTASLIFDGGILQANADSSDFLKDFSAGEVRIESGGAFIDTNGYTIEIGRYATPLLAGTGGLTKLGEGTLVLLWDHIWSGDTTINGGTLQIGAGLTYSTITSMRIINNATLKFVTPPYPSSTYGGLISGTGKLVKDGGGTLILSTDHTYSGGTTVAGGTLQVGTGGTTGSIGSGDAVINGTLAFNRSDDLTYGATISGSGNLVKIGPNALTLTGDSAFGGVLQANGGTLVLEGNSISASGMGVGRANDSTATAIVSHAHFTANNFITVGDNVRSNGTLTIGDGGIVTLGLGAKLTVGWENATGTLNLNTGGTVEVGGANGLQKAGSGRTYFNFASGTLRVVHADLSSVLDKALSGTSSTVDTNGFNATFSGIISGEGALTKSGNGILSLTGVNTFAGGSTITGGHIEFGSFANLGSGDITLDGGGLRWESGNTVDVSSRLTGLGARGAFFDTNGNDVIFATTLTGPGGITKQGGGTLTLTAPNGYLGGTTVEAGTLRQGAASAFTAGTAYTVNGGTLDLNGHSLNISSLRGAGGMVSIGAANLAIEQDGDTIFAGGITSSGGVVYKRGTGSLALSGNVNTNEIHVNGGTLVVSGQTRLLGMGVGREDGTAGTVIVSGIDAHLLGRSFLTVGDNPGSSGTLTVKDGGRVTLDPGAKLTVGWDNATGTLNLNTDGTIELGGANGLQKSAAGTTNIRFAGGTLRVVDSALTSSVDIELANVSTGDTNNLGATLSGKLSGDGGLLKTGQGRLLLETSNTYTGSTTIDEGILALGTQGSLESARIHIAAGAFFDASASEFILAGGQAFSGDGTILGDVLVSGTVSPGSSIGRLTFADSLTLDSSATLKMELGSLADFDRIAINGSLIFGGTLEISFLDGFAPEVGDTFRLFDDFILQAGQFDAISFVDPGFSGGVDYETGTLQIASIPEPSVACLSIAALVILCRTLRSHRNRC